MVLKKFYADVRILKCMFQAVPYSRDYKRKYEYMKSQLRKPVSVCSMTKYVHTFTYVYCEREGPYKDVHVSCKGMENISYIKL
jgi:hypothetical protein